MEKVNIKNALALLDEFWSQQVVGEANGTLFKVAKGKGEVNWHKHEDQDEVFIVIKGRLNIRFKHEENILLEEGEMLVVPKGIEHSPVAEEEVHLLVMGLNITSNKAGGKPAWSSKT